MTRLERTELVNQLEALKQFHEDKANYYYDWLEQERLELSTIGFVLNDDTATTKISLQTINADTTTHESDWY